MGLVDTNAKKGKLWILQNLFCFILIKLPEWSLKLDEYCLNRGLQASQSVCLLCLCRQPAISIRGISQIQILLDKEELHQHRHYFSLIVKMVALCLNLDCLTIYIRSCFDRKYCILFQRDRLKSSGLYLFVLKTGVLLFKNDKK